MSEPSTADIIAALHGDQAALARVRGGRGSWSRTAEGIVAADRLAELDAILTAINEKLGEDQALRPPCPTCGGKHWLNWTDDDKPVKVCPDCVDGKVSIEQLVATYNAVMADGALPRNHHLRRVKP